MTYISDSLRKTVSDRAKNQCEYCLLHEDDSAYTHEIDHIIPEKHRGETIADNLCLACLDCNRNNGSDFASFDPETDKVALLFHPRNDSWGDHFELKGAGIVPLSSIGRVTVFVLKLNDPKRLAHRRLLIAAKRYPPVSE